MHKYRLKQRKDGFQREKGGFLDGQAWLWDSLVAREEEKEREELDETESRGGGVLNREGHERDKVDCSPAATIRTKIMTTLSNCLNAYILTNVYSLTLDQILALSHQMPRYTYIIQNFNLIV